MTIDLLTDPVIKPLLPCLLCIPCLLRILSGYWLCNSHKNLSCPSISFIRARQVTLRLPGPYRLGNGRNNGLRAICKAFSRKRTALLGQARSLELCTGHEDVGCGRSARVLTSNATYFFLYYPLYHYCRNYVYVSYITTAEIQTSLEASADNYRKNYIYLHK